jgi:protein-tyrosine phosphatase
MIDIHCHILPGLDDGPPTIEESLLMCRIAADDGITAVVATPH